MFRLIFCVGLVAAPQLFAQQIFQCGVFTAALGINNSGTVVGYYYMSQGGAHGFIYSSGSCSTIDIVGATNTVPYAINDSGTISGYYIDNVGSHGFLRSAGGAITTLDFPMVNSNTTAYDINNSGNVIISSNTGFYLRTGTSYSQVTFTHGVANSKLGINDAQNVIVGTNTDAQSACFIDSYPSASSTPFSVPGAVATACFDINNLGSIAGTYFTQGSEFAFVRVGSAVTTLQGLPNASANGLNDVGQVVGHTTSNGQTSAFITNLNTASGVRGDFDKNGVPDVVLQFPDGSVGIWYLNKSGRQLSITSFAFVAGPASGFAVVDAADLNGDGVPDLILRFTDGSMGVWYMGGTQGSQIQSFAIISLAISGWVPVGAADLNGDGHQDLVIQNKNDGSTGVWYLGGPQGNQIQGFGQIGGPLSPWNVVGVADLDNDGHPDVILQQPDGTIGVWYLIGSQGTAIRSFSLIANPSPWSVVGVTDVDGDGHPDLVIRNNADGTVGVWFLGGAQGNQITGFSPLTGPGGITWRVLAAH